VTDAYAGAAARLGVKFLKYTEATGIVTEKMRLRAVKTAAGDISTAVVLNAAGAYAGKVAAMAGLALPIRPERHEVLVTEPVNPLQGPMVISMSRRFYCQQTPHGNFIMGQGEPNEPESFNIRSRPRFLTELARKISQTFPLLGELRVIRQWAGLYEMTPDAHPILGESEELTGFLRRRVSAGTAS
jgi:sarcosine oxidase subunit beta